MNTLRAGKFRVRFALLQADEEKQTGKDGAIHLSAAPFEIRFSGDIDRTFIAASSKGLMAAEMNKERKPIIYMGASGAYRQGVLLLAEKARLVRWDQLMEAFGESQFRKWDNVLHGKLGTSNLAVIEVPTQFVATYANNRKGEEFAFRVQQLYRGKGAPIPFSFWKPDRFKKVPWSRQRRLSLVIILTSPIERSPFCDISWRQIRIQLVSSRKRGHE